MGITICVAAGDDGSSDGINDGHAHVDFPCASPYVLAVGGTLLRTGPKRSERAWKDGDGLRADNGGSTGGGVSTRIARPAWQSGLDIAPVNPGQQAGRIVPDVAANASANTGYFVVAGGQQEISGGTSASAPLWAALVARMNQQLAASGKRVGYLTPLLYGAAAGGARSAGQARLQRHPLRRQRHRARRRLQVGHGLRRRHRLGLAQGQGPAGGADQGAAN